MLIIVENGDVHFLFQALFDDKTFGRFDVFEVDAAKGRAHQADRVAECVGVFGVQLDVDGVHIGEAFEEDGLALHHWLAGQCAKVAKAQNSGAVRDHSNEVSLVGIIVGKRGVGGDIFAGHRDAGGICERQIALRCHRNGRGDLPFARCWLHVERERVFAGQFRLRHGAFSLCVRLNFGRNSRGGNACLSDFRR